MSKKTIVSIVSVLGFTAILVGLISVNAFAKGSISEENRGLFPRLRFNKSVVGSIISLGDNEFTIQRKNGMKLTFQVNDDTLYRNREKEELSFDDLKAGDWILVRPDRAAGDASLARLVMVLPEGFNPTDQRGARGIIRKVDTAANTFTLQTRGGEVLVAVDANTVFRGQLTAFSDLKVEMQVTVVAQKTGEREFVAEIVGAGAGRGVMNADGRLTGMVTELGNNQFTIKDRLGETHTIQVTPDTTYLLGLRRKASFSDIKIGSRLLVTVEKQDTGIYKALVVVISPVNRSI